MREDILWFFGGTSVPPCSCKSPSARLIYHIHDRVRVLRAGHYMNKRRVREGEGGRRGGRDGEGERRGEERGEGGGGGGGGEEGRRGAGERRRGGEIRHSAP